MENTTNGMTVKMEKPEKDGQLKRLKAYRTEMDAALKEKVKKMTQSK